MPKKIQKIETKNASQVSSNRHSIANIMPVMHETYHEMNSALNHPAVTQDPTSNANGNPTSSYIGTSNIPTYASIGRTESDSTDVPSSPLFIIGEKLLQSGGGNSGTASDSSPVADPHSHNWARALSPNKAAMDRANSRGRSTPLQKKKFGPGSGSKTSPQPRVFSPRGGEGSTTNDRFAKSRNPGLQKANQGANGQHPSSSSSGGNASPTSRKTASSDGTYVSSPTNKTKQGLFFAFNPKQSPPPSRELSPRSNASSDAPDNPGRVDRIVRSPKRSPKKPNFSPSSRSPKDRSPGGSTFAKGWISGPKSPQHGRTPKSPKSNISSNGSSENRFQNSPSPKQGGGVTSPKNPQSSKKAQKARDRYGGDRADRLRGNAFKKLQNARTDSELAPMLTKVFRRAHGRKQMMEKIATQESQRDRNGPPPKAGTVSEPLSSQREYRTQASALENYDDSIIQYHETAQERADREARERGLDSRIIEQENYSN